jgi:hypothetical protein
LRAAMCGKRPNWEEREAVRVPGDGKKRLMPDAWRSFTRCTEGNRNAFRHDHYTAEAIADDARFRHRSADVTAATLLFRIENRRMP